jgi:predicted  nucleic acid-binding Zn-ribbon protein
MGVERAVTRWYAQRQMILYEIASLETKLHQIQATKQPENEELAAMRRQLAAARAKLRAAGACPKAMMG